MTGGAVGLWQDSVVGGHGVAAGCVAQVPAPAAGQVVEDIVRRLQQAGFRAEPAPAGIAADVRVLRRGSLVADTLLTGTGIAALRSRLGPLSLRATVVVEHTAQADGSARIVTAMVAGDALAPEVAAAVDGALAETAATGVPVTGEGWMRAVDVPGDSLANPRTAQRSGIR